MHENITRRKFTSTAATLTASSFGIATGLGNQSSRQSTNSADEFKPKYILASCMYGYSSMAEILPEVPKTNATAIDIWPKVHGNQREQLDKLGEKQFKMLLKKHQVSLGCITQYKLGPFGLKDELAMANRLGCHTIVTGGRGPKMLKVLN